jgi:uncharacterized membrane protein YraQ (UPF0718 family)
MKLDGSLIVMWAGVAVLILVTWRKKGWIGVREGFTGTWGLSNTVIKIIPFALLAATIFTQMIPQSVIAGLIGEDTGLTGMVIAAVAGGMLPSGPFLSFPLAMTLFGTGAGQAQIVSFLTGWSVYAFYRVIVWELPSMGVRFTAQRLAVSIFLPIISGCIAGLLFQLM